jgi:hypothetical protein
LYTSIFSFSTSKEVTITKYTCIYIYIPTKSLWIDPLYKFIMICLMRTNSEIDDVLPNVLSWEWLYTRQRFIMRIILTNVLSWEWLYTCQHFIMRMIILANVLSWEWLYSPTFYHENDYILTNVLSWEWLMVYSLTFYHETDWWCTH